MAKATKTTIAKMAFICAILFLLSVLFFIFFQWFGAAWMETVFISVFTCFYHLCMRLFVGESITLHYKNKDFPRGRFDFVIFGFEKKLYERLHVKAWAKHARTAKPEQFDVHFVLPKELLHNVLQAELVHRICAVLSYLPLLLIIPFGAPWAFIITSVFGSFIDLYYVMIQRYNRPRVLRHLELSEAREARIKGV